MEQYCITLEQVKKLKDLGFEGDSEFMWMQFRNISSPPDQRYLVHAVVEPSHLQEDYEERGHLVDLEFFPAYHVGELLELLPNEIDEGTGNYFLTKRGQLRGYLSLDNRWLVEVQGTKPEAEAFGDLLIYLLESKLI